MKDTLVKKPDKAVEAANAERTRNVPTYNPRVDIWENDAELVLYGDLPGVSAQNLEIRFEDRELTIHGHVEPRETEEAYLYNEYGVGDFYRTFAINEAIDTDKITAEVHNGVLTLHLPKTEAAKPRRIEVKTC